jgi:CHASE3 domain sensor protein
MQNDLKDELHHIISGKSQVSHGALIQTIASYLDNGSQSSDEIESSKQIREQETKRLESFVTEQNLWIKNYQKHTFGCNGV